MKNSKNLFRILLIAVITLSSVSCIFADKVKGNGNVVKEERQVRGFDGISASAGLDIILSQGEKEFVEVEADENLLEYIITEVKGTTLKVHWKSNTSIRKYKKAVVHVTCKDLNRIKASSGSDIVSKGIIKTQEMDISTSSAADVTIAIEAGSIICKASSGSDIRLKGKTTTFNASCSSGADIKANGLEADLVDAKASSGADIVITVIKEITASASSGADITYYGNPEVKNVRSSSGGDINHRE